MREAKPAMEQAFTIQDFSEFINQTNSIAGLDLNLEQIRVFRNVLFCQFTTILMQRRVLCQQPSQNGEEGLRINDQIWFVCNEPFKKLFVVDYEVLQGDVMYLMAVGGIGSQRPDIYFNFQDGEYQERHHGQSIQPRLHICRGKRKNTNRRHTFEIFQQESVIAMKVFKKMLEKASPEFEERRQAVALTNNHCLTLDKLWFHLGESNNGNNNPGVIPVLVVPQAGNIMVVPRANLKTKFYNRCSTSLQNVMTLSHLPPLMNFFDLRKTMATATVRDWRRTKGRPVPLGEARREAGVSLHWWLLHVANEMDTSLERLQLSYIYVPCNAVFSDQDLEDIHPEFRNLRHPEVLPMENERAGERCVMARQTVAQSVAASFM